MICASHRILTPSASTYPILPVLVSVFASDPINVPLFAALSVVSETNSHIVHDQSLLLVSNCLFTHFFNKIDAFECVKETHCHVCAAVSTIYALEVD